MHTRAKLLCTVLLLAGGCSSTYYSFWESLGYEKRDIFVERVEEARDSQEAAKEEFQTTLERFQEVANFEGGELEAKYDRLNSAYERASDRASAVSSRIDSVEQVATDLFEEWEGEIDEMSNQDLKSRSADLLSQTKSRYSDLIAKMHASEEKMEPVLTAFKDRVLFLKANLNAQAISSLQDSAVEIEDEVRALIAEMDASIQEANDFIDSISGTS